MVRNAPRGVRALPGGRWLSACPSTTQALRAAAGVSVNPASAARAVKMAVSWSARVAGEVDDRGESAARAGLARSSSPSGRAWAARITACSPRERSRTWFSSWYRARVSCWPQPRRPAPNDLAAELNPHETELNPVKAILAARRQRRSEAGLSVHGPQPAGTAAGKGQGRRPRRPRSAAPVTRRWRRLRARTAFLRGRRLDRSSDEAHRSGRSGVMTTRRRECDARSWLICL